jgi:hypothetical protein
MLPSLNLPLRLRVWRAVGMSLLEGVWRLIAAGRRCCD